MIKNAAVLYYLHDGRGSEELFDKGAGGEVVTQTDGQVL
jgi:hypothetical protein